MENNRLNELMKILQDIKSSPRLGSAHTLGGIQELKPHEELIKSLLPTDLKLFFADLPTIRVNNDSGELTDSLENSSILNTKTITVDTVNNNKLPFTSKYVYITGIEFSGSRNCINIRCAESTLNLKKTVTFTITENIYNEFSAVAATMAINKSKFVENRIVDFLKKHK